MKGKVRKVSYWIIDLPKGKSVSLSQAQVDLLNLKDGEEVEGEYSEEEKQIRYSNGEYAREYQTIPQFQIKKKNL